MSDCKRKDCSVTGRMHRSGYCSSHCEDIVYYENQIDNLTADVERLKKHIRKDNCDGCGTEFGEKCGGCDVYELLKEIEDE